MKKAILAVLLVSAMIGMSACSGSGSQNSTEGSSQSAVSATSKEESTSSEKGSSQSDTSGQAGDSKDEKEDTSEKTEQSSAEQVSHDYRQEDAEYTVENGLIVVNQDGHYRALELFGGGTGNAYVDALNDLRGQLDSSVRIFSMPIPLACEYYLPANYEEYSANQKEYFDDVASRLNDGITSVDADSVLGQHVTEPIYLRTDHHWCPLGAYYATQEFAKAAGLDFKDLNTYESKTISNFVGTMYAFTEDPHIKDDPEDFTYYVPSNYSECETDYYDTSFNYSWSGNFFQDVGNPESNAYLTFFGGDEQIVKVRTNVDNGKKLIIIKDSYGNAVPGYLMGSYEEIYVVDMRYFNLNLVDFIEQMGISDVLFTMVSYSVFGDNSYGLSDLLTQHKGETIVDGHNG